MRRLILFTVHLLLIFISRVHPASCAVIEGWVRVYDSGSDSGYRVAIDGSGNVVVTGSSAWDFYTAKYSGTTGALLWEKRHDPSGGTNDSPTDMVLDHSGNVVVTGVSSNEWYTVKYAGTNGALLWERRYSYPYSAPLAAAVDSNGNVAVTGTSASNIYTAKYAAVDGVLLWERRFGTGLGHEQGDDVAVDCSGNVIVTGSVRRAPAETDFYTAKYAEANGALLWERRYNGPSDTSDRASALALDAVGNVVVTGHSGGDYYTAKYAAANGALLWEKRYINTLSLYWDQATAVAVDSHGNAVVTGAAMNTSNPNYYTAKYAATDGTLLWEKRYDSPGYAEDKPNTVILDRMDNVLVTGSSGVTPDPLSGDYYTAKYAAADGALLWERRYNGSANQRDGANGAAIGQNGMIVVTGSANSNAFSPGSGDCATIVYWEDLSPMTINIIPDGARVRLTGAPGRSYEVQRANAVSGPWTTIATATAPAHGLIEYIDADQSTGSVFYRARTE